MVGGYLIFLAVFGGSVSGRAMVEHYRPIIGVVAMDLLEEVPGYKTKIPASMSSCRGGRILRHDFPFYERASSPGGDVSLDDSCYAARALQSEDYYPIGGTCLGFELLLHLTDPDRPNLTPCHSQYE
ncbi:Gamma-glutamyl hydrolase, partial [Caligus rogercresseyi]